jgi:hypothetical protein
MYALGRARAASHPVPSGRPATSHHPHVERVHESPLVPHHVRHDTPTGNLCALTQLTLSVAH